MMNNTDANSKAILVDITKCTGCEKCVDACIEDNNLDPKLPVKNAKNDDLSGNRFTSLVQLTEDRFVKKNCLHCLDPGCVNACIAGALKKTDEGPVVYDPDQCIGCRYCMLACPAGIPRYEWDKAVPYVRKCDMCYDRVIKGKNPACVEACPNNALTFGNRKELLKQAKKTISENLDKYIDHVYGEHEFAGTSVLYISDIKLDEFGWKTKMGSRSITDYTWPIISKTPILGGGVAAFLTGTMFIINRRMKIANEKASQVILNNKEQISENGEKS